MAAALARIDDPAPRGAANDNREPGAENWPGSRFRYTGQIALPEVSLYHYKGRVYDPALGRFLQTDPVGGAAAFDKLRLTLTRASC